MPIKLIILEKLPCLVKKSKKILLKTVPIRNSLVIAKEMIMIMVIRKTKKL